MPVGTRGSIKGLTAQQVADSGAEMVLSNTYHLALRPGAQTVAALGGLHTFMGWNGPILTDSGGFQIFSLAGLTEVSESGAVFRSHVDGKIFNMTPEDSIHIQEMLGSDVAMVLDHVVRLPAERERIEDSTNRTIRWAARCRDAASRLDTQVLFAIVQGGLEEDLRLACLEKLVSMDFYGYAVGGLAVGESVEQMHSVLDILQPALPENRPRYLMGVGTPGDLLEAIRRGIDLFDCVLPTRNGRNGLAFTDSGALRLRNACHATDSRPLDEETSSLASGFSRGYLRHLFMVGEMLGPILLSSHNLAYYQRLVRDARSAIQRNCYLDWMRAKIAGWSGNVSTRY